MIGFITRGRAGFGWNAVDLCRGRRYRAGVACGLTIGEKSMGLDS